MNNKFYFYYKNSAQIHKYFKAGYKLFDFFYLTHYSFLHFFKSIEIYRIFGVINPALFPYNRQWITKRFLDSKANIKCK